MNEGSPKEQHVSIETESRLVVAKDWKLVVNGKWSLMGKMFLLERWKCYEIDCDDGWTILWIYLKKKTTIELCTLNGYIGIWITFFLFWPHHMVCGILVSWPGIEPVPPAVKTEP